MPWRKDLFRDEGRILAVLDENSDEAIAATLLVAREKFGSTLTLTGSPAFQQRVVEVAVAQGIAVKFADPALEEARVGMITARRSHSGHAVSIAPSTKSAQQEHVQPAESATGDSSRGSSRSAVTTTIVTRLRDMPINDKLAARRIFFGRFICGVHEQHLNEQLIDLQEWKAFPNPIKQRSSLRRRIALCVQ